MKPDAPTETLPRSMTGTWRAVRSRAALGGSLAHLVASIAMAATPPTASPGYWAYRPVVRPALPEVRDPGWIRTEPDRFILAALEGKGLKPAPEADRHQLVRRLYFDLIGLPPTTAEAEAFVNDTDPKAYEKCVDRLLADPRHGERWARFWLDLARYADTAGYEGDPDLPQAWRYRDYVIDAFNHDKPYDQFIREQIAGDELEDVMGAGELPEPKPEQLVALTFLRLAPFTEPRGDETRHEMLSEMTATVGSVFLGLTVGCAKCHDHKYDAIPTRDFYRLKAFFSTVQIPPPERGDGFQIGGTLPAAFYRPGEKEWADAQRAKFEKELSDTHSELESLTRRLEATLPMGTSGFAVQASGPALGNDYTYSAKPVADGAVHAVVLNGDTNRWTLFVDGTEPSPTAQLAGSNRGGWFARLPSIQHISLGRHTAGTGQPKDGAHAGEFLEVALYDHPLDDAERAVVDAYVRARYRPPAPGGSRPLLPSAGLRLRLDAADIDGNPATPNPLPGSPVTEWIDSVGGIRLSQSDPALRPALQALDPSGIPAVRFENHFLKAATDTPVFRRDSQGALVMVFTARQRHEGYGFEVGGDGSFLSIAVHPGAAKGPRVKDVLADAENPAISKADRERHRELQNRERLLRQNLKRLQPTALSLRHAFGPPYEPGVPTSRVLVRGEYDNPGEVVEAGFLSCIAGNDSPARIRLDPFKRWPTRSRRKALAEWIASPENPLTARVLVNRLWQWHFGRGLVPTPSDLGKLSGGPTHPELLDWLANKFVAGKWSLRAMHRLIVTSAAYRQASQRPDAAAAAAVDPDNTLLWRFRSRRLEAEAVRDSILAVSGRLNPTSHGLPIFPPLPGDLAETVKFDNSKWDTQTGPEGRRRSLYIYQQRTLTMPLLQVFDGLVCDDSRPTRPASVTPLQALALSNGTFVHEEARHFAARVQAEAGPDAARQIDLAFRYAFSRAATPEEIQRMQGLAVGSAWDSETLVGVCRVLLNASEFLHLD